ncbi:triose-phosphate isomerase [Microlunatus ginsengisoli]|uniref:Triose-phosphate isomerase n=1 Tax=Microlunatus ginsengisoli TaxID=363863 RepID=A0ABP6ZFF9_9ACTN
MTGIRAPFFEIGPKNLLRRADLEQLARVAGQAGQDHGVTVVLTVPTAMIAPIRDLDTGVLVFAQTMDAETLGATLGRITAESLVDAGAAGVMLNHDSNPMAGDRLAVAMQRARCTGLETIVCADTTADALGLAELDPTAILLEPPALIGRVGGPGERDWIVPANRALRGRQPQVLVMHAGGVSSASVARSIMSLGADGTGSTSGVLAADDPHDAVRTFIAATRAGWEAVPH